MPVVFRTLEEINEQIAGSGMIYKDELANEIIRQCEKLEGQFDVALPQAPYDWVGTVAEKLNVEAQRVIVSFVWFYPKDGYGSGFPLPINMEGVLMLMRLGAWA